MEHGLRGNERAVLEVECQAASERRECGDRGEERQRENTERHEKAKTPRLRAPVGTPGETGVRRPDGRKPEACEGAGPGSGGVTGNPVAGSERETQETLGVLLVLGRRRRECDIQGPGVTPCHV